MCFMVSGLREKAPDSWRIKRLRSTSVVLIHRLLNPLINSQTNRPRKQHEAVYSKNIQLFVSWRHRNLEISFPLCKRPGGRFSRWGGTTKLWKGWIGSFFLRQKWKPFSLVSPVFSLARREGKCCRQNFEGESGTLRFITKFLHISLPSGEMKRNFHKSRRKFNEIFVG